jgi:hypothetical protein
MKTPRVATVHNAIKESGRVLPHPSVRLPSDTSTGIRGWLMHYPNVDPIGMVSSDSMTLKAIKFAGLHKSRMRQYISNLLTEPK